MDNVQRMEHANALQDTWEYIVKSVSLLSIVEYVIKRFLFMLKWSLLLIPRFIDIGCSNYCFNEGTHSTCTIDENGNPKCNCWYRLDATRQFYKGDRCEIEGTEIAFHDIHTEIYLYHSFTYDIRSNTTR